MASTSSNFQLAVHHGVPVHIPHTMLGLGDKFWCDEKQKKTNTLFPPHQQSVFQSTTFRPGCPSHFQVSNRKKKMPTFLNLLVLILELSGRCGASSRRSCGNVTFGVDVGVLCIKRSVSRVTKKKKRKKPKNMKTGEAQKKKDTV